MKKKSFEFKITSAIAWLIFTVSLASWWLGLGLQYIGPKKWMIISEGLTLIFFIIAGGVSLIMYMKSEHRMRKQTEEFFASNNHEVKTYITSLRLKAEGLVSDLEGTDEVFEAQKIIDDTVRLELQVENSLLLAAHEQNIFKENINLKDYFQQMSQLFSDIDVKFNGEDYTHSTDKRMFDIITKNIIQNAKVHAGAKCVNVDFKNLETSIELQFTNDGQPFLGNFNKLGELYYRHSSSSRSGIGLYLVKQMITRLNGQLTFSLCENSRLVIKIVLPISSKGGE